MKFEKRSLMYSRSKYQIQFLFRIHYMQSLPLSAIQRRLSFHPFLLSQ
jgi:hypothetical protein